MGTIDFKDDDSNVLQWTNRAGALWDLLAHAGSDQLFKLPGSPYQDQYPGGNSFDIQRKGGKITGFDVLRALYSLDPIQETFGASIQKLLSEVLEDAQHRLRDIRLASQLFVSAQMILERVDEEREKDKARRNATVASQATLLDTLRGLLKSLVQPHSDADVRAYMEENGLIEREAPFDAEAYIAKERGKLAASEWRSSDLDTRNSDRFQTIEQVEITLGIMLEDLHANRLPA